MPRRLIFHLFLVLLTTVAAACNTVALDPETTVPLKMTTSFQPTYAGTPPSRYDGIYQGYFYTEILGMCGYSSYLIDLTTLEAIVSNGKVTSLKIPVLNVNPVGFVNNRGVFYAQGDGERAQTTLAVSGKIEGDRMYGEWQEWGWLCSGHFGLIRETGGKHFCVDRLTGKKYSSAIQCRGTDEMLTRTEFETGCRPVWVREGINGRFEKKCGFSNATQ